MSHSATPSKAADRVVVALCGNPNSGKTTVFNALTGLRQRVANYPGVTVDKVTGQFRVSGDRGRAYSVVDVPGTYSLSAFSPDEFIATQVLCGRLGRDPRPDVIVAIIDATNLERSLYLVFQVLQVGRPVVLALNMMDLVRKAGIAIDAAKLSRELGGLPVVPIVGSRGEGINELKAAIGRAVGTEPPKASFYDGVTEGAVSEVINASNNGHRSRAEFFRIVLDAGGPAEASYLQEQGEQAQALLQGARQRISERFGTLSVAETGELTRHAERIVGQVASQGSGPHRTVSERVDRVLLHPVLGPVLLGLLMVMMFQSIFSWANPLIEVIDSLFSQLSMVVSGVMPEGPLQSLITDGIIGGVGSVLVFLPQIVILFLFIALIEDTGYMPRAAFLVDRLFSWCGLSGKSFIPMLSSFACAVPGIMATRTIEDRKLRFITILVAPLMSCSARLPVYTIMIAAFIPLQSVWGIFNTQGLVLTALYLLGLVVAVTVSFILNRTILKTQRGTFMMEMPSYKVPTLRSVFMRVFNRARSFVVRAGTVILAITVIIWALSYFPRSHEATASFDAQAEATQAQYRVESRERVDRMEALVADGAALPAAVRESMLAEMAQATSPDELEAVHEAYLAERPAAYDYITLAYAERLAEFNLEFRLSQLEKSRAGAQLAGSYFGRVGRTIEPVFAPLGWDWKITMATLAAFPAREVIIATLGTIYNLGDDVDEESSSLIDKMRNARWDHGPRMGERVYSPAVALSIMVFFALCCQCGATLVTIRQETGTWLYPVAVFAYMTGLAYLAGMAVYQVASGLGV